MEMKIPAIAITAVVVVIVLAGVLMPVLDDTTAKDDTFTNTGLYYLMGVEDGDSYTYILDAGSWTVNGETITFPTTGAYNVIVTDSHYIRNIGQVDGYQSIKACNLTVTDGSITGTYTNNSDVDTSVNWTFTDFYGATPEKSSYIMTDPTKDTYVNSDSVLVGYGVTQIGSSTFISSHIVGDMSSVTVTASGGYTVSNVQINKTAVDGHEDLYEFDSVTFDVTKDDSTSTITYNRVITVSEVTADRSDPMPDNQSAILMVIPIMIIVALLVAVVALVFRGRNF